MQGAHKNTKLAPALCSSLTSVAAGFPLSRNYVLDSDVTPEKKGGIRGGGCVRSIAVIVPHGFYIYKKNL